MIEAACALSKGVLGIKRGKNMRYYVFVCTRRSAGRSFVGTAVGKGDACNGTSTSQGKKCLRHLVRLQRELYSLLNVSSWKDDLVSPSGRLRCGAASNRDKGSPQNAAPIEASIEASIEEPIEASIEEPIEAPIEAPVEPPNRLNKSVRKLHKWTPVESKRNSIMANTVEEKHIGETLSRMYTLMSRTPLSRALQLSEQVSNKDLYKTVLMKYFHEINRRDRRGMRRGGSITWSGGTTNELLRLFLMCSDYYMRMQGDRVGDTRIHTCEGNQFEDIPAVCRDVLGMLAQGLRTKSASFKLREMNDLVIALLRLRMVDPFVVGEDTTNDLIKRFSSRLFRVNCDAIEPGEGGPTSEWAAMQGGVRSKHGESDHVADDEGRSAASSTGQPGRISPPGAIHLGDLAKVLYQLVTMNKRLLSHKKDSPSDRFTEEHTTLVNAILAYSKSEIKKGTLDKDKLFWRSCTSLLYSLTVLCSKKWHADCIEIYDHVVRTYDVSFDVDSTELVSLNCYDFKNFGKEHWPEEEVKRVCLLRSISLFCNSKATTIKFVLSTNEKPEERHTFLTLEELIKLTYAVTFFYKQMGSSGEEDIKTKCSHRVRGIISSLLLITDGLVERAVLDVLPVKKQNDADDGNKRSLLKRLSHLANVYHEHRIGDMKLLCALTVLISKCRDVDLIVLSNVLNIFTKLDFSYDAYFVSFFFSNCMGKGYLGEEVLRIRFFERNGGSQSRLSDHTDENERNDLQEEKKKPMAFYIWRAFIKCVKRSVADKQKLKELSPVNITKLVNGLIHFKCLDKQSIEVLMRIISEQYRRGESVGIINRASRNTADTYRKIADTHSRTAGAPNFNLVSLGSLLNYMSMTDDIQCYEAKIKLVQMIADKVVNRENSFDARLLCSIYISYARLNIHDVGLFYIISKRLKSSQLNDLNVLSILSYMNKAGIYDEQLLRSCFNNAFAKWRRKTKQRLSYAVHLLFILTSISQTFLFDNFYTIMCRALEIISYVYSVLHTFHHFFLDIHLGENSGRVLDSVSTEYLKIFHFFLCQHWEAVEGMGATNSQIQRNVLTALRQVVSQDVCICYEYALRGTPYLVDMRHALLRLSTIG
ncbi:hypothetical protein PCYB_041400 [Plasmodium cynomolgi strain B]|uniref:Uncharacterized protein n=1 Tax=Plasmodium cynomolgi (strain B) TaxID=1120755 RepID=K6UIE7_PLACD|nr:hypothetical protein PCYB_041400 [Plasmodium cynomolgi strain B]GAB64938.1 hypothetical protein PCYB_041400 [Plasmodium cynomolgi strain B]